MTFGSCAVRRILRTVSDGFDLLSGVRGKLQTYASLGFGVLPICIAKTQYSLSHDPKLLGRPEGFRLPIRDVQLASGAGFIYAIAGDISTMPERPVCYSAMSTRTARQKKQS